MNQNEKVLAHLVTGKSITPLEALGIFGIYRLGARIHDLKTQGHDVTTTICRDPNGKPYAKYRLVQRSRSGVRKKLQ